MLLFYTLLFSSSTSALTYPDYDKHECKRKCDGTPMTCRYNFTVEQWYSMNPDCRNCLNGSEFDCYSDNCIVGDGSQKLLSVVNRRFPGPTIQVCKGDKVIVNLANHYTDYGTSMHWHGQFVRETPFMDGVRSVTQCPIPLQSTFKYVFYAEPGGTFFYHAHMGGQKSDGTIGALIVREPASEVNPLYDYDLYEHAITLVEMNSLSAAETLYRYYILKILEKRVSAITINGFGSNATNKIPPHVFTVKQGFRYRFRTIQAGAANCIMKFFIEKHNLTVIATDGSDIDDVTVESINMMNGERFDFVLHANQSPGYYWIIAKGYSDCKNRSGIALLKYEGAQNKPDNFQGDLTLAPDDISMNCIDGFFTKNCFYYYQLKSKEKMNEKLKGTPTFKYYIAHDMVPNALSTYRGVKGEQLLYGAFNNIVSHSGATNLLEGHSENTFCNASHKSNCDHMSGVCQCTHVVQIPANAMVEMIIVDEGEGLNETHALHLHGYAFYVVAQERLSDKPITVDYVKKLDNEGKLKRNLNNPALKDTLATPNKGYVIIRFEANNQGYWSYHCHIDKHLESGFSMVFKVGNPSPPPQDFPKCGNYLREDY